MIWSTMKKQAKRNAFFTAKNDSMLNVSRNPLLLIANLCMHIYILIQLYNYMVETCSCDTLRYAFLLNAFSTYS